MRTIVLNLLLIATTFLHAQEPVFNWVNGTGSDTIDTGISLTLDDLGNVYVTGSFRNTVDFDPGPDTFFLTSAGESDIYIQKLSSRGDFLWAISIGGIQSDYGTKIDIDNSGDVVVCGKFWGTVDFNPGPDTAYLHGNSHYASFILEVDTNGSYIWAGAFTGSYISTPTDFAFDANGNRYILGYFAGTIDFDPGPAVVELTAGGTQNWWDIFIQKMDSANNFLWAKQITGDQDQYSTNIEVDLHSTIVINGHFTGITDFDPGPETYNLTSLDPEMYDYFMVKLDSEGRFRWAFKLGSSYPDYGDALTVDHSGNIISMGKFGDVLDFDPGPEVFNLVSSGWDSFIQKLDSNGNFIWAKKFGENGTTIVRESVVDEYGSMYSAGHFMGTPDLDPGPDVFELDPFGVWDIFIQKLDSSGDFCWAKAYGGDDYDDSNSIRVDNNGAIYLTGYYEDTVRFFNGYPESTLVSNGMKDMFLLKLDSCYHTYDTISVLSCDSYQSPSGNYVWDSTGIYYDRIPNSTGCDSIISINLTVIKIDTSVLQDDTKLIALDSNCSYQWVDCNNGYTPIPNDTNQSFIATENGSFAVILTNDICVDTSACFDITTVWVNNQELNNEVKVYPVPSEGSVTIDLGKRYKVIRVSISSIRGDVRSDEQFFNREKIDIDFSEDTPGIYYLNVICDDLKYSGKILIF
jgi:hypothetical protein